MFIFIFLLYYPDTNISSCPNTLQSFQDSSLQQCLMSDLFSEIIYDRHLANAYHKKKTPGKKKKKKTRNPLIFPNFTRKIVVFLGFFPENSGFPRFFPGVFSYELGPSAAALPRQVALALFGQMSSGRLRPDTISASVFFFFFGGFLVAFFRGFLGLYWHVVVFCGIFLCFFLVRSLCFGDLKMLGKVDGH